MVSFGDVRRWAPEPLDAAEQQLKDRAHKLLGLADELSDAGAPAGWTGGGSAAAGRRRAGLADRMEHLVAGVTAARRALMEGADAVTGLRRGVTEADELARVRGFRIDRNGAVHDAEPPEDVPPDQAEDVARERERIKAELADRVEQILRRAADIDEDLSSLLGRVAAGDIDDGGATNLADAAEAGTGQGGLSVLEPPEGQGTPGSNAGWWDTLGDAEQQQIIAEHPEWIGNRDGIPFGARDEANRALLVTERAELTERAAALQADLDDNIFGGLFTNADKELAQVQAKLDSIDAVEATLDKPGERQLLVLNMSETRAEAAIANGNVDTADHVAVFTPGLDSTVDGSIGGYDANMDQLRFRSEEELARYGDGGSVATVTWIGYQAPQLTFDGVLFDENSVVSDHAAKQGAEKLTPFLQGIDTARDTDPHLTTLGHSYGSTTTGHALRADTGVDDAVFYGSPGIGTSDITDLKVPDGHSFYLEARNDPVGDLGHFGIDPSHMDGMEYGSARETTLPDGRELSESTGHSAYTDDGSTSQYNLSVVVGGMSDRLVSDDGKGFGDVLSWPVPGTY